MNSKNQTDADTDSKNGGKYKSLLKFILAMNIVAKP